MGLSPVTREMIQEITSLETAVALLAQQRDELFALVPEDRRQQWLAAQAQQSAAPRGPIVVQDAPADQTAGEGAPDPKADAGDQPAGSAVAEA